MADSLTTIMNEVAVLVPSIPHSLGFASFEALGVPPRVAWVVGDDDSFGPPMGQGRNPRPIWTIETSVDVHIWGTSVENMEAIRQLEIAAIHKALWGSYAISGGKRINAREHLANGVGYVLSILVRTPVGDSLVTTGLIDEVTHYGTMEFKTGGSDTGACGEVPT